MQEMYVTGDDDGVVKVSCCLFLWRGGVDHFVLVFLF